MIVRSSMEKRYGIDWNDTHGTFAFSHATVVTKIAERIYSGDTSQMWLTNMKGQIGLSDTNKNAFAAVVVSRDETPEASEKDIELLNASGFPFLKVCMPKGRFKLLYPLAYRDNMPWEGRPWFEGNSDCYRLALDYYRKELGIHVRAVPTPPNYTVMMAQYAMNNLFMENWESSGFEQVMLPEDGDALLIKSGLATFDGPDHVAVFLEGGKMLHHFRNRLSVIQDYSPMWREKTLMVLRHSSRL